jgi:ABC-type multidrug transport system fused ATPase/permease subunit
MGRTGKWFDWKSTLTCLIVLALLLLIVVSYYWGHSRGANAVWKTVENNLEIATSVMCDSCAHKLNKVFKREQKKSIPKKNEHGSDDED